MLSSLQKRLRKGDGERYSVLIVAEYGADFRVPVGTRMRFIWRRGQKLMLTEAAEVQANGRVQWDTRCSSTITLLPARSPGGGSLYAAYPAVFKVQRETDPGKETYETVAKINVDLSLYCKGPGKKLESVPTDVQLRPHGKLRLALSTSYLGNGVARAPAGTGATAGAPAGAARPANGAWSDGDGDDDDDARSEFSEAYAPSVASTSYEALDRRAAGAAGGRAGALGGFGGAAPRHPTPLGPPGAAAAAASPGGPPQTAAPRGDVSPAAPPPLAARRGVRRLWPSGAGARDGAPAPGAARAATPAGPPRPPASAASSPASAPSPSVATSPSTEAAGSATLSGAGGPAPPSAGVGKGNGGDGGPKNKLGDSLTSPLDIRTFLDNLQSSEDEEEGTPTRGYYFRSVGKWLGTGKDKEGGKKGSGRGASAGSAGAEGTPEPDAPGDRPRGAAGRPGPAPAGAGGPASAPASARRAPAPGPTPGAPRHARSETADAALLGGGRTATPSRAPSASLSLAPSPAAPQDAAELRSVEGERDIEALRARCRRLVGERAEARARAYEEATLAVAQSTELDSLRRTRQQLLDRLQATESQLLAGWTGAAPGQDARGGASGPDASRDMLDALVDAKMDAADANFRVLELQGTLRDREKEIRALRASLEAYAAAQARDSRRAEAPRDARAPSLVAA